MRKSILSFLAFSLLLAVAVIVVTSFDFATTSSAQNANSSTTTNKNQNDQPLDHSVRRWRATGLLEEHVGAS
jgi:hypothetical protein